MTNIIELFPSGSGDKQVPKLNERNEAILDAVREHAAALAERDDAIWEAVHKGSDMRIDAKVRRRILEEAATWIEDADDFVELCQVDMDEAAEEDKFAGIRAAASLRRAWLRFYKYYDAHANPGKNLEIVKHKHVPYFDVNCRDKTPKSI